MRAIDLSPRDRGRVLAAPDDPSIGANAALRRAARRYGEMTAGTAKYAEERRVSHFDLFAALCFGFGLGAAAMWAWFAANRLIRTRREWYGDPIVRARYPEEADRAFYEDDGW